MGAIALDSLEQGAKSTRDVRAGLRTALGTTLPSILSREDYSMVVGISRCGSGPRRTFSQLGQRPGEATVAADPGLSCSVSGGHHFLRAWDSAGPSTPHHRAGSVRSYLCSDYLCSIGMELPVSAVATNAYKWARTTGGDFRFGPLSNRRL